MGKRKKPFKRVSKPSKKHRRKKGTSGVPARDDDEKNIQALAKITSPTALQRLHGILGRNDFRNAPSGASPVIQTILGQGRDDGSSSEWSLATTDNNRAAGWAVFTYFYRPVGLWIEKTLNRLLGPHLIPPSAIGKRLEDRLPTLFMERCLEVYEAVESLERQLMKSEFSMLRRLMSDIW